ncbi:MAG: hypothetical protein AB7T07_13865 [Steroidobacteraceae bacterium]
MRIKKIMIRMMLLLAGGITAATAGNRPDFSGVWEMADLEYTVIPEENHPRFTEQTRRDIENYQKNYDPKKDDPVNVCFVKGMPWTMLFRARGYPMEVYQTDKRVVMFFEPYDGYRNIRLDRKVFPDSVPRSANGYSIGHWEGDTLVIETRNLTGRNPISPTHRSEQARIIERWKFQQDAKYGQVLDVDVTMDDPEVFIEPAKGHGVFKRAPAGVEVGGYNCSEALWSDYIDKRRAEVESKR